MDRDAVTEVAESYYDSQDADAFYFRVWGGEDIHIGIYERPDDPIFEASQRSTYSVAQKLGLSSTDHVLDLGAGYGGAARWMADKFGCKVTCLNLSEVQNDRNRRMNAERGLSEQISVVHGAFESLPFEDGSFDHVWSQDAILHSGDKPKVFAEAARVLRPGGHFAFTDPMQAAVVPEGALDAVLARIHLDHMGSFKRYGELAAAAGLEVVSMDDLTSHLVMHYSRVGQVLEARRPELEKTEVSTEYLDRMLGGLSTWVEAGRAGHLAWGIINLRR